MNLYLDTSSLAKLYLKEEDSQRVQDMVAEAEVVATSVLSDVEMRSVVARRLRERLLTKAQASRLLDVFEMDWPHFGKVAVDAPVLKKSGGLIMKHPLRTLDAIQLASAQIFEEAMEEPVVFL